MPTYPSTGRAAVVGVRAARRRGFPAVALARRVGEAGGTWPAVYNAANEVAVDAFHEGRLGFVEHRRHRRAQSWTRMPLSPVPAPPTSRWTTCSPPTRGRAARQPPGPSSVAPSPSVDVFGARYPTRRYIDR